MRLITDSALLSKTFNRLCSHYRHYKWTVAWAGDTHTFDLAKLLKKNESKIEQIVVGLHFYQTSPNFIETYMDNEHVRFLKQSDGTFHTKMYLFYNDSNDWEVLVGSSNFTQSGFHKNYEANVLLGKDSGVSFKQINDYINLLWTKGESFSQQDLDAYTKLCKLQKKKRDSLEKVKASHSDSLSCPLNLMTWDEYLGRITTEDGTYFANRLEILSIARRIFAKGKNFDSLDPEIKKALAGFIINCPKLTDLDLDWRMFGSMRGAGTFKQAINDNIKIGKALDIIPYHGAVEKKQFDVYCKAFAGWKDPLAGATRLLAIKRPDLFVCVNKKNRKELSKLLDIPQSHIKLENYWNEVLIRIYDSAWFNDKSTPASDKEKLIKKYQVAMLDSISYRYD